MADKARVRRRTVDLSGFPDLVVIYLGMAPKSLAGLAALGRLNKEIALAVAQKPDGLLLHEPLLFSLVPLHFAMRQYWRDLESLEAWTRQGLHKDWWTSFLRDPKGTGFWHETYCRSGGFEAIYDDIDAPVGMMRFAPLSPAKGPMFSARARLTPGATAPAAPVLEDELG